MAARNSKMSALAESFIPNGQVLRICTKYAVNKRQTPSVQKWFALPNYYHLLFRPSDSSCRIKFINMLLVWEACNFSKRQKRPILRTSISNIELDIEVIISSPNITYEKAGDQNLSANLMAPQFP